uniref:EF-hand domain-containing protein n=1 Tax=Schistosoma mansoni TaxID=6183 RepID=A0A5K4F5T4_SCHMA
MKNFFEGLGKSRGKNDISGRTSPINLKPSESDEANKDQQTDKKETKSLPSSQKSEESNTRKNTKDTIEKTNNASDKSREVIKTDEKKTEKQTSPVDTTDKPANKADSNLETPQDKPTSSVRLIDRVNQGPTTQINEKNPSSTLINFLTSPIQTIKSGRAPSPTTPPTETKPADEVKDLETNKKSSELKEKQNKNSKDETNEIHSKKVESQSDINVGQKKENISSSQPAPNTKTEELLNKDKGKIQITKSQDDKVSESQNKSNNIVTKSVSEIPIKKTEKDKPKNESQVSKPEVSQSNTNYLVPSNIPQPDTYLKLGRNGVITRSEGGQLKPYQPKITSEHHNPPDFSLTSDKGVNRSIATGQKEREKYNESQRSDLKNLDPCRPVFFSAIDLKRSGFANAEDIENCWNKLGVPDVENLLKYLGFPKHGMINLDHLTQALHEALEMNTYDEPSVLAGIRSMNLELHLTEVLKNAYGKEIEKFDINLTEEREMILRYFHQQLNEIRQKMEILLGQKEVEIKEVQQKLDKTIQSSNEIEIKNKDVEFLLQTEDKFLNFITNLSDIHCTSITP